MAPCFTFRVSHLCSLLHTFGSFGVRYTLIHHSLEFQNFVLRFISFYLNCKAHRKALTLFLNACCGSRLCLIPWSSWAFLYYLMNIPVWSWMDYWGSVMFVMAFINSIMGPFTEQVNLTLKAICQIQFLLVSSQEASSWFCLVF